MPGPLKVLIAEDDPADAEVLLRELVRGGFEPDHRRVENAAEFRKALLESSWDIVICDHAMPSFDSFAALKIVREMVASLPFIVVSGSVGEEIAVEVMKAGANDYLMKDKLIRLAPAVEHELREAEARRRHDAAEAVWYRLGLAVEGIAEIVTLYDADDRLVLFNRAFRNLNAKVADDIHLGMTFEELIRVLVSGGLVPEDTGREESWISERLERHRNPGRPLGIARQDDIWVRTNEQRLPDGGSISISLDITEQKRAEAALRESEARYARAVAGTSDGIWDWNLQTDECYFAPRWAEILGYAPDQLAPVRKTFVDLLDPVDRDRVSEAVRAHVEDKQPYDLELRLRHKSGEYLWIRIRGQAVWDEDGRPLRMAGSIADITEQRDLEQQRRQAEKMEALGVLAGGIAHDFNNMLFAIIGLTESVRNKIPDGDARRRTLDGVIEASERAKELVRQILAFSRQDEPSPRRIDLSVVAEEALRLIRATLPSTIEIRHKLDPNCGGVVADPTQIHQVIVNLAANAADAMEGRPGLLEVGLDRAVVTPGSYARLTVSDTGRGMDARTRRRIFDPFFTTKEIGLGTGMGLAVVHGIVTSYGGTIVVSSEAGRGTRFEIYLPSIAVESEAQPDPPTDPPAGTPTGGLSE